MMLDFELGTELYNHSIVEIGYVIGDDPLRDTVSTDEVILDKLGYNVLSD